MRCSETNSTKASSWYVTNRPRDLRAAQSCLHRVTMWTVKASYMTATKLDRICATVMLPTVQQACSGHGNTHTEQSSMFSGRGVSLHPSKCTHAHVSNACAAADAPLPAVLPLPGGTDP